jgi:HSP20 family protein
MLTRWYDTPGLRRDLFQSLFDDNFRHFDLRLENLWDQAQPVAGPRFTVRDDKDAVTIRGDLPGMSEGDLSLTLENGALTISGARQLEAPEGYRVLRRERLPLKFSRTFRLAKELDGSRATAQLESGVLTLTIPKAPEAQPRQIPIKSS